MVAVDSSGLTDVRGFSIRTGDELEGLADQFNDMGARLQESYTDLEHKVEKAMTMPFQAFTSSFVALP